MVHSQSNCAGLTHHCVVNGISSCCTMCPWFALQVRDKESAPSQPLWWLQLLGSAFPSITKLAICTFVATQHLDARFFAGLSFCSQLICLSITTPYPDQQHMDPQLAASSEQLRQWLPQVKQLTGTFGQLLAPLFGLPTHCQSTAEPGPESSMPGAHSHAMMQPHSLPCGWVQSACRS